ncbi:MAG: hypothetical protein GX600_03250 [Dehalococcoidia bacterium]|jgi:hypothetical protein|nr:hypothetical protein [Dehalococcoidia bacterium]
MDDTAFHYSPTLRLIMILAIVIPIVVIVGLLWYFGAFDGQPTADDQSAVPAVPGAATGGAGLLLAGGGQVLVLGGTDS